MQSTGAAADEPGVRLGSAVGDDLTPILYAQDQGLSRQAGLDLHLQVLTSGSAGAAAILGGALDIAKSSTMAIVLAHARSIPLRLIAPAALYLSPQLFAAMVAPKASPLRAARDLGGKTIAVTSLADVQSLATMAWLDENGGDSTAIRFVELPSTAMVAALGDGRVDAAVLVSPILDAAVNGGSVHVVGPVYSGIAKRFLATAWYASDGYIARNDDTVRRFAALVRDANAYCSAHAAETLRIIAAFEHIDPATIQGSVRAAFTPALDPRDIQPLIDTAAKYKMIDKPFPARDLIAALPTNPN